MDKPACLVSKCSGHNRWNDASGTPHEAPCDHLGLSAALLDARYSHTTTRSWCGSDLLHVYNRDADSPTLVTLAYSCLDTPETRAILAAHKTRAVPGPTRGVLARL